MANKMTSETRARDMETIYQRFLTPEERTQRALLAGKVRGLNSVSAIAKAMGVNWTTANGIMTRENVSIRSICRLAYVLDCSVSFLTERDLRGRQKGAS